MKTIVLAEKPSVGKDIARVLNCRNGKNGYIEGDKYIVTWALGHLVTLADPEEYDPKYRNWDINHLPIMPDKLRLTVIPQTSKQYRTVKELLLRKDVSSVVVATDAGREGELVARWIIEKAKCNKPIKRLWISSVTDKAIKDGFNKLKDGKDYQNLFHSAKARAEADWLVGINATRCLTTKFNSQLSCGRVQTPTVAIIAHREEEIRKFVPQPFYDLSADAGTFNLMWQRTFDKDKAATTLAKLQSSLADQFNAKSDKADKLYGTVTKLTKTIKKKYPPKLYNLTELQRDASTRLGYSPKETLSIMQRLYEEHKILTYPRTDSRYISTDIVPTIPERLRACGKKLPFPVKTNSNFVNNELVSDHHAIIPTEHPVNLLNLGDRERKIYDMVINRFLCVFYPPYEYEQVSLTMKIGKETFSAKGKVVLSQGYRVVKSYEDHEDSYGNSDNSYNSREDSHDSDASQSLPPLKDGDHIPIKSIKMTEGKTKPPSFFNEATLLSAMESPVNFINNKNLAETLKQTGGLGTVATRADIIEKLFDNFLIEKRGKEIYTTSKGRQLLTLVPDGLRSPELTGNWEQKLSGISKGTLNKDNFMQDIRKYTREIIKEIKDSSAVYRHDNLTSTKCPSCGKFMLQVAGKKGEMLVCQDRECNERVNLSMSIRSKCPRCHKFLKIVGAGDKRTVVCSCGHKEKYENFDKRKKEEKNNMSKRDVQAYLNKMNKKADDNIGENNPFAALKGMLKNP